MKVKIAVVDTGVLIILLATHASNAMLARRRLIELTLERLAKQGARFVVPTPVVAELCAEGPGSKVVRRAAKSALSPLRVEGLDEDAADVAGAIARMRLLARQNATSSAPGSASERMRGAVKYDALIAGIAHHIGATWLVTTDPDDMRAALQVVTSSVHVVTADAQPEHGQHVLLDVLKPANS